MTRKKVKLAFITNDSARKATFKKRKKGLLKKMDELTTLCGVDACAIIYGPYEPHPEVWPGPLEAKKVLSKFKRLPEMEQSKKMMNHEEFLMQRVVKASEQLNKMQKENREKEMIQVMYQCLTDGRSLESMNLMDLCDLQYVIDQNLKEIQKRLDSLRNTEISNTPLALPMPSLCGPDLNQANTAMDHVNAMVRQPTFMEMMMMIMKDPQTDVHADEQRFAMPGPESMMVPYVNHKHNTGPMWSSAFFK